MDLLNFISFLFLVLLYPVLTGPVAALIYVRVLKQDMPRQNTVFWVLLLVGNLIGFAYLAIIKNNDLIEPSFFACLITPFFAVLSALILRLSVIRENRKGAGVEISRGGLLLGTVGIPTLQLLTMFIFVLLAPYLSELGIWS